MTCDKIRIKSKNYCIGDLNKKAVFLDREIDARTDIDIGYGEIFKNNTSVWCAIETKNGKDVFSGTDLLGTNTHDIITRYNSTLVSKKFILLSSRYLKILRVQDLNEEGLFLKFVCNERGLSSLKVNEA